MIIVNGMSSIDIHYLINPIWHGWGAPPSKVLRMLNFDVVMTPTMSRNIFEVIWRFWKICNFWVILESFSQLKRIFDLMSMISTSLNNCLCLYSILRVFCIVNQGTFMNQFYQLNRAEIGVTNKSISDWIREGLILVWTP